MTADETLAEPDGAQPRARVGATVMRRRGGEIDAPTVASILVKRLGIPKLDALEACTRGGGILADNVDPAAAEGLAADLKALGEDCIVVPAGEIVTLSGRRAVHAAHLTHTEAAFVDADGHATEAPWSQGVALVAGAVGVMETELEEHPVSVWRERINLVGLPVPRSEAWEVTKTETEELVDVVFTAPLRWYRINARQFDFSILGQQEQPGSDANIHTLARWLVYAMPHVRTNFDNEQLLKTGQLPLETYPEHHFRNVLSWLTNLALHDQPEKA
jgi:hypothetical protein